MQTRSIFTRQHAIEREFDEPLRDVVAGFIPLGMTAPSVAETLGVDPRSLKAFCQKTRIRFPANQPERAERIRATLRHGPHARTLALNGRRQCLAEWAEEYGIKPDTLRMRLNRGKPLATALRM